MNYCGRLARGELPGCQSTEELKALGEIVGYSLKPHPMSDSDFGFLVLGLRLWVLSFEFLNPESRISKPDGRRGPRTRRYCRVSPAPCTIARARGTTGMPIDARARSPRADRWVLPLNYKPHLKKFLRTLSTINSNLERF